MWTMLIYVHVTNNFTFMCEHTFIGHVLIGLTLKGKMFEIQF
jgi:hypothetical protein